MSIKTIKVKIEGMTCDHCAASIEKALNQKGIIDKRIRYSEGGGTITFSEDQIKQEEIIQSIHQLKQYKVTSVEEITPKNTTKTKKHLVIIGGGSAAFAAALRAHELGSRITMINGGDLPIGGTCVNVGCVPSKNLIRAAESLYKASHNLFAGIQTQGKLVDFKHVINQKRELVHELQKEKYVRVIQDLNDFEYVNGFARFVDPHTIEVNGRQIRGDYFLIATGASPMIPSIPGLETVDYLTNETAFELEEVPEKLIVLGGNYIGLEIAQIFARFGSKVTIVELLPHILPNEDTDVVQELQTHLENEGIRFLTKANTTRIEKTDNGIRLYIEQNNEELILEGTHLLIATGRKANTSEMGLEKAGVHVSSGGFLKVNSYLQTSQPHIYGAGDVIGKWMFVYTAAYEGKLAIENIFSDSKKSVDYTALPWVIFTDPQVAGIGMNEKEAQQSGKEVEIAKLEMKHVPRALAARDTRGFIKLLREKNTDLLLGARIVAPEGAELLMELALAIKYQIPVNELKDMFHPYLTLSEGIKLAAITFSKSVEQLSCCAT